ncbi:MAG: LemA family protein [Duodenibacillus sp.]|nr:LemA family protein [Duodenibacillus sp.]
MIALAIAGVIVLLIAVYVMTAYNALIRGRNLVKESWSGIDVQLKRRHDLIPNLVNTVKGYAKHEQDTLVQVTEARASAANARQKGDVAEIQRAENALASTLKSLFAVAESYPDLKASANFMHLQEQLTGIEEELQLARRYYNGTARNQNNRIEQFPGNIVAGMFRFEKPAYFEVAEAERENPAVTF